MSLGEKKLNLDGLVEDILCKAGSYDEQDLEILENRLAEIPACEITAPQLIYMVMVYIGCLEPEMQYVFLRQILSAGSRDILFLKNCTKCKFMPSVHQDIDPVLKTLREVYAKYCEEERSAI